MRKTILAVLAFASMSCHAETDSAFNYKLEGPGGVEKTTVKTWSMDDPKAPVFTWVTTVMAQGFNTNASINAPVKASGSHRACWNNSLPFGVTASYVFTLSANGKMARISNRFNLPGRTIKCIDQVTYVITSFPLAGNFPYRVASHAETNLTTPQDSQGNAYIMVK